MYKAGIQVKSIALETWVHCDLKKDFREGLYGQYNDVIKVYNEMKVNHPT